MCIKNKKDSVVYVEEKNKPKKTLPEVITAEVLPDKTKQPEVNTAIDSIAKHAANGMKETIEEIEKEGIPLLSQEGLRRLFTGAKEKMFKGMDGDQKLQELKNKKTIELGDGNS